jgi:hypothetical protein
MLGMDRSPQLGRGGCRRHLREDFLQQGREEVAKDLLILSHPRLVGGVGHRVALLAGRIDSAIDERRGWRSAGLDVVPHLRALDGGGDLRVPHIVVGTSQLLRDGRQEAKSEGRHGSRWGRAGGHED